MNEIPAVSIKGYHVTKVEANSNGQDVTSANVQNNGTVNEITVNHNSNDINVVITYAPNGTELINKRTIVTKQTVHYEGAGDLTPKDNVQSDFTFTYSGDLYDTTTKQIIRMGSWNAETYTYSKVKTPVVKGYYADEAEAGGFTAKPDDPTHTYTVTYKPLGKIIPVTPDGNPIPNVPNPPYENNPTNPTQVTPNEPVPDVPGYTRKRIQLLQKIQVKILL